MTSVNLGSEYMPSFDKKTIIGVFLAFCMSISIAAIQQTLAYSIMTFGDLDCSPESKKTIDSALRYLGKNRVDLFIFLGDINYKDDEERSGSYYHCGKQFFENVVNSTELRMVRGNHENNNFWAKVTNDFNLSTEPIWYERAQDVLLVGLESEKVFQNNSKEYGQLSSLLSEKANHKIIFIHSPVLPEVCTTNTIDTKKMCGAFALYHPLFIESGVDCIIQAHIHTMAILQKGSICYTVYGMGGAPPHDRMNDRYSDKKFESEQYGFVIIDVEKETHTFYANNGTSMKFDLPTKIQLNLNYDPKRD